MSPGADIAFRFALMILAAAVAIAASMRIFRFPKHSWRDEVFKPPASEFLAAMALNGGFLVADWIPLFFALEVGHIPAVAGILAAALYAALCLAAIRLLRKGLGRAVFAAGTALVMRWVLYALFTYIYSRLV